VSAWIVGGAAVLLLRQPGVPAVATIWAEDGHIFLSDALLAGPLRPLAAPYAGYLILLPRVISGIVSPFPIGWASGLLAVAAALVVSALSAHVFVASRELFVTSWARSVLAAMVLLLPAAGWESLNNVTNLQWSLILPALLGLLVPTAAGVAVGAVVVFIGVTTSPVTLLFLPLAVHRLLRLPARGERIVVVAYLVGAFLQVTVSAIAAENPFRAPTEPLALPALYGLRVAGSILAGDWVLPWGWSAAGPWLGFIALAIALALVALGSVGTRSPGPLVAAAVSFALFAFPVLVRGTSLLTPLPGDLDLAVGSKWVVGPSLVLLMGILLGIDPSLVSATRSRIRRPSLVVAVALTAVLGVSVVAGFRVPNERSPGPRWSEGILAAARACDTDQELAIVPVSPFGWNAVIPCERIEEDQVFVATTSIWRPKIGQRNLSER
jgi:hypothetical protein